MKSPIQHIADLERRILRLEAALQPFAAEADQWSEKISSRYRPGVTEPKAACAFAKAEFSIGDLRRAKRLLVVGAVKEAST